MWRLLSTSLSLVLALICTSEARSLVFLPDDRLSGHMLDGEGLTPIGVVDEGPEGYATAFLISECEALTVRHIFGSSTAILGRETTFYGNVFGHPRKWRQSKATVIAAGQPPKPNAATPVSFTDWALLRLHQCLGKEFGYFSLSQRPATVGEPLEMAGFPSDRPLSQGVILDPLCYVRGFADGMALHDCAALPGNSGSPVFRRKSDSQNRIEVVGMGSGAFSYGGPGASLKLPVTTYYPAYANRAVLSEMILSDRSFKEALARN